jgi:hypothetical protein
MGPSLEPQRVDKRTWYYEYRGSILVVHEAWSDGGYINTEQFRIPWRKLEVSMKRCRTKKGK